MSKFGLKLSLTAIFLSFSCFSVVILEKEN